MFVTLLKLNSIEVGAENIGQAAVISEDWSLTNLSCERQSSRVDQGPAPEAARLRSVPGARLAPGL